MPSQENIEIGLTATPTPPTSTTTTVPATEEPQNVRELSQTDHLNRRLLKSLLESMQTSVGPAVQTNEDDDNDSTNNDFEE
ncbi:uncharacterized protein Dwil_GK20681 [Drosophila willistoni]|uniref:Uncharacterized protein n=1 Tax=Drosophila willistoni TaxID=7260 RepID=B4MK48_DROWI|nr:uncharacterized protein LOC6638485 [Drosophila willistoni]EDW72487.1 uncharacterized protein Dwil_GK20681 [Drosophila willistoni]